MMTGVISLTRYRRMKASMTMRRRKKKRILLLETARGVRVLVKGS